MQEVEKQCQCAGNCGCAAKPVNSFSDVAASGSVCGGFSSSLKRQNQSDTAVGSGGVSWRDNFALGESSSSQVTVPHASSHESAGCCGGPRSEISHTGLNSEAVLSLELESSLPTNLNTLERVGQTDAFVSEDNLGLYNEDPKQKVESQAVCCEPQTISHVVSGDEAVSDNDFCCKNQTKVNPTASGSVDVFSGHVSQTTPSNSEELVALVSQEGN